MNIKKDIIVDGKHGKPVWFDVYYIKDPEPKRVIIFAHGFKGFKDWGHWHLLATAFARAGFLFLKFNFSHNGTTPDHPVDFADLDAFGRNNYTIELADLDVVISWILSEKNLPDLNIDRTGVSLIGHSRGGGVAALKAADDERVRKLVLWASVASLAFAWENNPEMVSKWRSDGVFYMLNSRTMQQMPLYFQLFEDYENHKDAYSVGKACPEINIPTLVLQGDEDPAIPLEAARNLAGWIADARLEIIKGANHVFGGRHPYRETELPEHSRLLFEHTLAFLE